MILKGAEATRYFTKPDPAKAGILIAGVDPMRVAIHRQEVIAALIGPKGEEEMRLTRMSGADLRKDGASLIDSLKAISFFPGPRVVFVEDATNLSAPLMASALGEWREGDAVLVVTAGQLDGKSALKAVFDSSKIAYCAMLYDDPPSREEIEDQLRKSGLTGVDAAAMADLTTLSRALDLGDFRQLLEKISLYKHGDAAPLTGAEIAALAPATVDTEVDELIEAVAAKNANAVGLLMRRLEGQGVAPVTICIQALRHFRQLHIAATDPAGMQKARFFGPRRDAAQRQLKQWTSAKLEEAIAGLVEADLTLRSSTRAPVMAVTERALIRIAMAR